MPTPPLTADSQTGGTTPLATVIPAIKPPPPLNNPTPSYGTGAGNESNTIRAPQMLPDGGVDTKGRLVTCVNDAYNIASGLESQNQTRAQRSAIIQQVHDMAPPRNFGEKVMKAKAWQANFSTGWLAGIAGRNKMRLVNSIVTTPILTHSSVPDIYPDSQATTNVLRAAVTELYRDWEGFSNFLNAVAGETSLQGYCLPVFLDPWTWKPTFFKQEKTNVLEGSTMNPAELQLLSVAYEYPVQNFLENFRDEAAAAANGYQLENCSYAATHAVVGGPQRTGDLIVNPRALVDMLANGTYGTAYSGNGSRVVRTYLLFNVEADSTVSMWMLWRDADTETHRLLRYSESIFPSMDAVASIFAFDSGNTTIHSSKGIGRMLINQALALERTRNQLIDNAFLSSMLVMTADSAQRSRLNISVAAPFITLDKGCEINQNKFATNSEGLIAIDRLMTAYAEQAAGANVTEVVNPNTNQSEKTATEAKIDASKAAESADMIISRFQDQFFTLVGTGQRRALARTNLEAAMAIYRAIVSNPMLDRRAIYQSHATADEQVLRKIVKAYRQWPTGFDPNDPQAANSVMETIEAFAESPATIRAHVLETIQLAGVNLLLQQFPNDPAFNQQKMKQIVAQQTVGTTLADELVNPVPDETAEAEAKRAQMGETADMKVMLAPAPVSPRDNHLVHGQWLQQFLTAQAPMLSQSVAVPPETMQWLALNVNHLGEHLAMMERLKQDGTPESKELAKFYQGFSKQFQQVVQIQGETQAAQLAVAQHLRQTAPPPSQVASPANAAPLATAAEATAPTVAPSVAPPVKQAA